MFAWITTNITTITLVVFAVWFLNGLRKAVFKPRVRVLSYSETKAGLFVEVERQQIMPPWLTLKESWMQMPLPQWGFCREVDGVPGDAARFGDADLNKMIGFALAAKQARERETEELLKEERRAAN